MDIDRGTELSKLLAGSPQLHSERLFSGDSFADSLTKSLSSGYDAYQLSSEEETGSQILSGSRIFQKPTLTTSCREPSGGDRGKGETTANSLTVKTRAEQKISHASTTEKRPQTPSSIVNIARAGQRAVEWAGWMKKTSKELASRPRNYIERASDMWSGGKKHYGRALGAMPDENVEDGEEDDGTLGAKERYREKFALQPSERLLAAYYGYLNRVIPLYGKIYLGDRHVCYRSLATRTKV